MKTQGQAFQTDLYIQLKVINYTFNASAEVYCLTNNLLGGNVSYPSITPARSALEKIIQRDLYSFTKTLIIPKELSSPLARQCGRLTIYSKWKPGEIHQSRNKRSTALKAAGPRCLIQTVGTGAEVIKIYQLFLSSIQLGLFFLFGFFFIMVTYMLYQYKAWREMPLAHSQL